MKEYKWTFTVENVKVYPIDMDRLNRDIDKLFHGEGKPYPVNIEYKVHGKLGIIKEPSLSLIDDEFVGHDLRDSITFNIFESEDLGNGHKLMSCGPTYEVTLALAQLEDYLLEPVSLAEFTKERRGYNLRIRVNEAQWLSFFNGGQK